MQKPRVTGCDHGRLDERSIREAVRDGLGDARAEAGITLRASEIVYRDTTFTSTAPTYLPSEAPVVESLKRSIQVVTTIPRHAFE